MGESGQVLKAEDMESTMQRKIQGMSNRGRGSAARQSRAFLGGDGRGVGFQATLSALACGLLFSAACSPLAGNSRVVETPAGEAVSYGPPQNTEYVAEVDAMQGQARLVLYRSATCDVLPVKTLQRFEEKLQGKRVVERRPLSKKQVVGEPTGQVACDQSYARDVDVMFEVDGGRFPLGKTNDVGTVEANLVELFSLGSFEEVPERATIVVRPIQAERSVEAGSVSFAQLQRQQSRVVELVAELKAILAKGESGASPAEITESYEIYSQLVELAAGDPRVEGLRARFWELLWGRQLDEARERMSKNLEALSQAKETLKMMGDAAIPIYVQAAVNSGTLDRRALEWSSLRLINALRGGLVCSAGYSFAQLPSYGWPADARLAAQYVHFGYGAGYTGAFQTACGQF